MTNKELLEDLLIEFDELDMQPMLLVPDPVERAKNWKHELTYAIRHLKAEAARGIFEELETVLYSVVVPTIRADGRIGGKTLDGLHIRIEDYNTIKKKYTEE